MTALPSVAQLFEAATLSPEPDEPFEVDAVLAGVSALADPVLDPVESGEPLEPPDSLEPLEPDARASFL
jgi:hypothetical protein